MSPELEAMLDLEAAKQQDAAASIERSQREHTMAYRTSRQALMATTTFNRPRQL